MVFIKNVSSEEKINHKLILCSNFINNCNCNHFRLLMHDAQNQYLAASFLFGRTN